MKQTTVRTSGWRLPIALGGVVLAALPAHALTIDPTFSTADGGFSAAAKSEIDSAISFYEATFTNKMTVDITFVNQSTGLGGSSQAVYKYSYSTVASWLKSSATASGDTYLKTAVAHLGSGNGAGSPSSSVWLTTSDLDALGHGVGTAGGTVDMNSSLINFTSTLNSTKYGGMQVIEHEMDEILGIGGAGSTLGGSLGGYGMMDLYRYSAPGTPSHTGSTSATAYFSIDGGATSLASFNQSGGGSDYGDWSGSCSPLHVQNAYGCLGHTVHLTASAASPEWIALQAIGYTVGAVPEPSTWALLGLGLGGIGLASRRRRPTTQ